MSTTGQQSPVPTQHAKPRAIAPGFTTVSVWLFCLHETRHCWQTSLVVIEGMVSLSKHPQTAAAVVVFIRCQRGFSCHLFS